MQFSAAQIAVLISGTVEGNPEILVGSFGKIEEAEAGQLSFLANPKYEDYLYTTSASIIIVNDSLELKQPVPAALIRVKDAYSAFATLLAKYQELKTQQLVGRQEPSFVSSSAKLGEGVFIGAFAYIGENVTIGNQVTICFNNWLTREIYSLKLESETGSGRSERHIHLNTGVQSCSRNTYFRTYGVLFVRVEI